MTATRASLENVFWQSHGMNHSLEFGERRLFTVIAILLIKGFLW